MKRTILATIMLVALAFSSKAYDFKSEDGLCYNITSSTEPYTVEVTYEASADNYSGLTTITIPETVENEGNTYSVTSVGERAFKGCSGLTSVSIPKFSNKHWRGCIQGLRQRYHLLPSDRETFRLVSLESKWPTCSMGLYRHQQRHRI